ncbi:TetR/AcrR family transcriptional regulator [Angustibacter luteus]|uniref:TetR/AcrR family transcriptional regulator n=1 Tax=Angustibacter luteus TaxID=658456 RepID=A0ABW1JKD8_9ACTN
MTTGALESGAFVGLNETSRRIVEAAVEAFADRGFHATTTRDIAVAAGLSPAGLYVHYPSKAAVLAQVSLLGHEGALQLVRASLATDPPDLPDRPDVPEVPGGSAERLEHFVQTFTAWHARHHKVARVVQYELGALSAQDRAEVARMRRSIESLVEGEVRRGVEAGELAVDDPHGVTRAVLSLCIDVARWFDPAGRESPEDVAALYGRLALRMLGASSTTASTTASTAASATARTTEDT